jgi:hypothetical protein
MWYVFQLAVMLAVGWLGVYFDWQHAGGYDHGIAPAAISIGAAWLATVVIAKVIDLARWAKRVSRQ